MATYFNGKKHVVLGLDIALDSLVVFDDELLIRALPTGESANKQLGTYLSRYDTQYPLSDKQVLRIDEITLFPSLSNCWVELSSLRFDGDNVPKKLFVDAQDTFRSVFGRLFVSRWRDREPWNSKILYLSESTIVQEEERKGDGDDEKEKSLKFVGRDVDMSSKIEKPCMLVLLPCQEDAIESLAWAWVSHLASNTYGVEMINQLPIGLSPIRPTSLTPYWTCCSTCLPDLEATSPESTNTAENLIMLHGASLLLNRFALMRQWKHYKTMTHPFNGRKLKPSMLDELLNASPLQVIDCVYDNE